VIIKGVAGVVE
jgi:hypothetical protein